MSDGLDDLELGPAAADAVARAFEAEREQPLVFAVELLLEALSQNAGWEELVATLSAEEFKAIETMAPPGLVARFRRARSD